MAKRQQKAPGEMHLQELMADVVGLGNSYVQSLAGDEEKLAFTLSETGRENGFYQKLLDNIALLNAGIEELSRRFNGPSNYHN